MLATVSSVKASCSAATVSLVIGGYLVARGGMSKWSTSSRVPRPSYKRDRRGVAVIGLDVDDPGAGFGRDPLHLGDQSAWRCLRGGDLRRPRGRRCRSRCAPARACAARSATRPPTTAPADLGDDRDDAFATQQVYQIIIAGRRRRVANRILEGLREQSCSAGAQRRASRGAQPADGEADAHAGTCWLMQWKLPPPVRM